MTGGPRVPNRAELHLRATYHAVLARNRLRRALWDLATPQRTAARVRLQALHWGEGFPFASVRGHTGDPRIDAEIDRASGERRASYFCQYQGDCLIEPRYGYVLDRPLTLLDDSMPYCEWSRDPKWRNLIGFPSLSSVASARLGRAKIVREPSVLSLRFYWEDNYFHFLNDVLPRVRMANEYGLPPDVPVVVGRKLYDTAFFRAAFPDGVVDGRRVVVQDGEFVASQDVAFARPAEDDGRNPRYVADLLGAPALPEGTRRVFLDRAPARGRYISNMGQVLPVLTHHGLEIVDPDTLSLPEQIELFASTELLVGIHGAGLANMIFRRNAPCSIIEIFPPVEAPAWFAHLAAQLGFAYDALSGYSDERIFDRRQPFRVDPARLDDKLALIESGELYTEMPTDAS